MAITLNNYSTTELIMAKCHNNVIAMLVTKLPDKVIIFGLSLAIVSKIYFLYKNFLFYKIMRPKILNIFSIYGIDSFSKY